MTRLLRKLLVKFVQMRHVKDKADVRDVDYANTELNHDNEFMVVGLPARTLLPHIDATIEDSPKTISFFSELYILFIWIVCSMCQTTL